VTLVRGGKAVYGASVGVLMLEARFPRIPGDLGNALSFPFPVHYRVVRGASPDRIVRRRAEGALPAFIEAARDLVAMGADGITTNCGFLSLFQAALQEAVPVPVATSALMQAPMIEAVLPAGKRVGVLTVSADSLTPEHLAAARVAPDTPVLGMDGGVFARTILDDALEMDVDACRADLIDRAQALARAHPHVGAILLECTNMTPHAAAIRRATGLPVYSMDSFVRWFQSGLHPPQFGLDGFA
jgi:Asp/Glu/hydantoin racemase